MKSVYILICFLFSTVCFSQNELLAQNYFDKGDFEKAVISYEELFKLQPTNGNYFQKVIDCYQQLKQFEKAEKAIKERLDKYNQASLLVELGYNYQLQKDVAKSKKYYEQAIDKIKKNPNLVYEIAYVFERKIVIDYALLSYETALQVDPKMNFNFQMAILYGQQGNTELMIEKFLTESFVNQQNLNAIQNQFTRFITEDAQGNFNNLLKKALLIRVQKNQDIFWNQYLSWFFVQEKEFGKAFLQEKAIFKRNPESFSNIINLAKLAAEENDQETAKEIYGFILENTLDIELKIQAHYYLMKLKIEAASEKDYSIINTELEQLLKQFGISPYSLLLQKMQAHFETFNLKNPEQGKLILKKALELPLNQFQQADMKMELADELLYQEKYNQALLLYSQIEDDLKNDAVGHEASFKIAKTSYFQADFAWATKQVSQLKAASTQLIANDALELFLLINDNTVSDSTQTDLKKFAHADFLIYQNKTADALAAFQTILKDHKTDDIMPITLYRIGKIYEKMGDFTLAMAQYERIIKDYKDCIYVDEAYYFLAEIANNQFKDSEKAKSLYEQIIFHHEDSIYFTDARKKYRQLRGDKDL